ncbi:MAG: hypothetical protein FJX76_00450 [Armatimonadetes bacterium]|nr:hypothetical protein [Armatimonadota bacterium]
MKRRLAILAALAFTVLGLAPLSAQNTTVRHLNGPASLKARFNAFADRPRLVLFIGPTCAACANGARYVDEYILKRYPNFNMKVMCVWMPLFDSDNYQESLNTSARFTDSRFEHLWDTRMDIALWLYQNWVPKMPPTISYNREFATGFVWDAFFLYPDGVKWDALPPEPVVGNAPIVEYFSSIEQAVRGMMVGKTSGRS